MNTRLQVEHPVTEAITGLDLVEWQFRVAAGEPLPLTQERVPLHGHAVEARIYAEDPRARLPAVDRHAGGAAISRGGVRVDTGVEQGSAITPFYDPMIAKLIAHAPTREAALDRLASALGRTVAAGPRTNLALLARALPRAGVPGRAASTPGSSTRNLAALGGAAVIDCRGGAFGAARLLAQDTAGSHGSIDRAADEPASPWDATDGFQLSGRRGGDAAGHGRRRRA